MKHFSYEIKYKFVYMLKERHDTTMLVRVQNLFYTPYVMLCAPFATESGFTNSPTHFTRSSE